MHEHIVGLLKAKDVKFKENSELSALSAIKIGGAAALVVYPKSAEEMMLVLDLLEGVGEYRILGRMSNVLPPDERFGGVIIKTDLMSAFECRGGKIRASAGVSLPRLSSLAISAGLSGLEELSGIPGSLGGAVAGNAGAYGREISELVSSVTLYSPKEKRTLTFSSGEMRFGYRDSSIKGTGVALLSAELTLAPCDAVEIKRKAKALLERRRESSPREPSLGSTFKRPKVGYASKMIDECGLRGFRIGDAAISEKHAGYIVNLGKASAHDVKALVEVARLGVKEKFGVDLEREIEYL